MNEGDNRSHQSRVHVSTRAAFGNLRTVAFIANISTSPKTKNTDAKFQTTCIAQLKFVLPGHHEASRIWVRVFAFSNAFVRKFRPSGECVFGFKVGDTIGGVLSPSYGDYKTTVFEAFDLVGKSYFDRITDCAQRDLDPWSDPLSSLFFAQRGKTLLLPFAGLRM